MRSRRARAERCSGLPAFWENEMDETKKILVARIVCAVSVLAVLVAAVALYVPLAGGEEQSAAVLKVGSSGAQVRKGVFGADMQVELVNDGPVTIIIDSRLRE